MDWLSAIAVMQQTSDPRADAAFRELHGRLGAATGESRVRLLRQLATQSAAVNVAVLIAATADGDPRVRREAQERLRFGHPGWPGQAAAQSAVGALRECLQSSSYWVRQAALETLHRIASAQPLLRPPAGRQAVDVPAQAPTALLARTARDPDRNLRLACCEALVRLGGVEAKAALKQFVADADEHVRTAAQILSSQAGPSPDPDCAS